MNKASLLELAKRLNIPRWNCMETKKELEKLFKDTIRKYKEIIFDPDTPVCMVCLDKIRKQQVIGKKVYDQSLIDDKLRKLAWDRLQKKIVMDGGRMIDGRASEFLDPEVDSTCERNQF